MALAKKGSRRIVVDGVEYRWRVTRKPCCDYDGITLGYMVEHAACPGTTSGTIAWLNGFRRLHRRYERKAEHFAAFVVMHDYGAFPRTC